MEHREGFEWGRTNVENALRREIIFDRPSMKRSVEYAFSREVARG